MKKKLHYLPGFLLLLPLLASSQNQSINSWKTNLEGEWLTVVVTSENDTLYLTEMKDVQVSSPRYFKENSDYRRYLMYKRYAAIVYPYAVEAIRIFREIQTNTEGANKRARKKYIRKLHKDLKEQFTDPLKNLTKTQGKILVKMIENELQTPLYDLIKDFRGGWTATYWNILGNLNGFSLKDGYIHGEDPILDAVLNDLDLHYPESSR